MEQQKNERRILDVDEYRDGEGSAGSAGREGRGSMDRQHILTLADFKATHTDALCSSFNYFTLTTIHSYFTAHYDFRLTTITFGSFQGFETCL